MRIFMLIAVVLFSSVLAAPARAGMLEDCMQGFNPDLTISGCTAVIRSGQYSGRNLAVAHTNRGNAYNRLSKYRRAIEDFDHALQLDPDYALAYNSRGIAYTSLGEHRWAIEDFDRTLRLSPGDAGFYNNRGIAYHRLGEFARAIEDYGHALRLNPGFAEAYYNRGNSYQSLGEYERAAGEWEQVIRLGGAPQATRWQKYLKGRGHYSGAIDSIFGPGTRRALLVCARDPSC
jgi:tetratricopeptide (TPR) repeat protein